MQETRCFPTTRRDRYWIELHEIKQDIVRKKLHLKNTKGFVSATCDQAFLFFWEERREKRKQGRRLGFNQRIGLCYPTSKGPSIFLDKSTYLARLKGLCSQNRTMYLKSGLFQFLASSETEARNLIARSMSSCRG